MEYSTEKKYETHWLKKEALVVTRLSGLLNAEEIAQWKFILERTMEELPDNYAFKLLVDLNGFKAENFEAHKSFRTVIPELLFQYGYVPGYVKMFPEAVITLQQTRGIRCVAMANVHQDETKMNNYRSHYSNLSEGYFTDSDLAMAWILSIDHKQISPEPFN